jgi:predicted anti-sigma-YlaC factor YlaD
MVNRIEPIDCRHVVFEISNFIEGEVSAELRARMEAHFKECAHCLAIFDGTRNVIRLVGDGTAFDVPAGYSSRLYDKLKNYLKT